MAITRFIRLLFFLIALPILTKPFTIVLDPAADGTAVGRTVGEFFERGITQKWARLIKKIFYEVAPEIEVVIAQAPREMVDRMYTAQYANLLGVDLYIALFACPAKERSELAVYYLLREPFADQIAKSFEPLSFVPYECAHRQFIAQSSRCTEMILQLCKRTIFPESVLFFGPYGLPLKQLIGINAPAIALECGITSGSNFDIDAHLYIFSKIILKAVRACFPRS